MKTKNEDAKKMTVVVVVDGVAKELHLPNDVCRVLLEAYEREKVVGISQPTYEAMACMLANKVFQYEKLLQEADDQDMFRKAVAFCKAFEINSIDSPLLVELMLWVDREVAEHGERFSSKSINAKNIMGYINRHQGMNPYSYYNISKDFKEWARQLFASVGLKISTVRFCKFYYSVVHAMQA